MRIGILGWGSLIWHTGSLKTDGQWRGNGAYLPIEFSRISSARHLTLVIDEENGKRIKTYWTVSLFSELSDAIENLRSREGEGVKSDQIGFLVSGRINRSLASERSRCRVSGILPEVQYWLDQKDLDAVIWTDLEPNFEQKLGKPFSIDTAVNHLRSLNEPAFNKAQEYFQNAPPQTETSLRKRVRSEFGWGNS